MGQQTETKEQIQENRFVLNSLLDSRQKALRVFGSHKVFKSVASGMDRRLQISQGFCKLNW